MGRKIAKPAKKSKPSPRKPAKVKGKRRRRQAVSAGKTSVPRSQIRKAAREAATASAPRARPPCPSGIVLRGEQTIPHQPDRNQVDNWEHANSTVVRIPAPSEGLCVVLSDIHFPYQDQHAVDLVLQTISHRKPHTVILNGDVIDNFQLSNHDQSPARARDTLQKELDSVRPFIVELLKHCKHLHYTDGNHESRTWRLIQEVPALYGLRALDFKRMAELPAAVQCRSYSTKLLFSDTLVHHGSIAAQAVAAATWRRFQSQMVVGHAHRASTHMNTHPITLEKTWVVAQGTLCDIPAATYADHPPWDLGWADIETWVDNAGQQRSRPIQRIIDGRSIVVDGKVYRG